MVRLYSLQIIRKENDKVVQLCAVFDINSLCTFFERSSYHEFITLFSKTIVQRTHTCSRQSIKQGDYMCHVFVRMDNLAGVVISDHEYPSRVAHTLLTKMLNDFSSTIPIELWSDHNKDSVDYPPLRTYLSKYQDPKECDALMKIQTELDETKIVLHNTIEAVLQRGEKLEDLVSKSEDLSLKSKLFYQTARKSNRCCNF